jgi:Arc/MetJ-type ribon-helix-helix transcriptional regulator
MAVEDNPYLVEQGITVFGKPVFTDDETGESYSEVTETIPLGEGFMVMPTINPETGDPYDREYLTDWYKNNGNVDPYSGEKLPVFESTEEADKYAQWRSDNMFNASLLDESYWSRDSGLPFPEDENTAELSNYIPTWREKTKYAISDFFQDTFGVENYNANKLAEKFTGNENASWDNGGIGLLDFTPAGAGFGTQEAKRDFRIAKGNDDKLGMGLAVGEGILNVAEAIPLTKAVIKPLKAGAGSLYELAKRIEVDPNTVGMSGGNLRLKPNTVDDATDEAVDTLTEELTLTPKTTNMNYNNTVTAYKLFRIDPNRPGELFPLYVDAKTGIKPGNWIEAVAGDLNAKTGKVKSSIGDLAFRPGWHAGDLPIATHIGPTHKITAEQAKKLEADGANNIFSKKNSKTGEVEYFERLRAEDTVWAEVEMPAGVDWQKKADANARIMKNGQPEAKTAHITDEIPFGGYYRYKTNPNMTGEWLISGNIKVNRVLDDAEVEAINSAAGKFGSDMPRVPYSQSDTPQTDSSAAQAVLDIRAAQMDLSTADRIQPSGENPLFDLSPESYTKTLPDQKQTYVPRQDAGTNKPLPGNDRGRPVSEAMDKIADRLAERMRPWLGTEAQYFYHTGPIVDKAMSMGFKKEEIYDWMKEFAEAYAATSPRTETAQNIRNATLVMTKRQLGLDLDDIVGPGGTGINERGYPMMIGRKGDLVEKDGVVKPLVSDGIHRKLKEDVDAGGINPDTNPKPATFAENVYGNLDGVTVDTHAVRGALDAMNEIEPGSIPIDFIKAKYRDQYKADPLSLNPATMIDDSIKSQTTKGQSKQVEYAVFSDIYRLTAEKLGVSPAEAQSMGWFGSGDSTGLASELKSVARLLDERIDVTAQAMNESKESVFKKLLNKEIPVLSLFGAATGAGLMSDGEDQPQLARGGFLDNSESEKGIMSIEGQSMADEKFRLDRAKADLNNDGKLSSYEQARGEAVQKAIKDDEPMKAYHGGMPCGCEGDCDGSCGGEGMMSESYEEGMMPGSYYDTEEETGNPVPVGSLPEEVSDDISALLSEGEYVLPADVVRWHGLKHIQDMMVEAKSGLMSMDMMGQLHDTEGTGEEYEEEEEQGEEEYETPEGNDVEVATVDTEEEVLDEDEDEEATTVSYAFKSTPKVAFIR